LNCPEALKARSAPPTVPQAAILFDKFHIMRHLGEALDRVRKAEYARLSGKDRRFIKGQKYTLLSRHENLSLEGKRALRLLLAANKRLNTATCSRRLSASSGTIVTRAGPGAFSTTGVKASNGNASNPPSASPT